MKDFSRACAVFFAFCLIIFSVSGCGIGERREDCLFFAERGFEALVRYTKEDFSFSAKIKASPKGEVARDFVIELTEPSSLCGIRAERIAGEEKISLGELEFAGEFGFSPLFLADYFEMTSPPTSVALDGENTVLTHEGEDGSIFYVVVGADDAPRRITRQERGGSDAVFGTVEIEQFTFTAD